jgi:formylmethanofuran dehydrogenase subunit E
MDKNMVDLQTILELSAAQHKHLCPRQVLGVRIGLAGAQALGLDVPRRDKRLLIFVETDGCFADGVDVATGCTMGHRTLRLEDYGKIAATFVDVKTETAVRVFPQLDIREKARCYAPEEKKLLRPTGRLPAHARRRTAHHPAGTPDHAVKQIVSRNGVRVNCTNCGEEIINEREIMQEGQPYCTACAGPPITLDDLLFEVENLAPNPSQAIPMLK